MLQIGQGEVLRSIRARKIFQVLDDVFNPGDAFLGFAQQVLNILPNGLVIGCFGGGRLGRRRRLACGGRRLGLGLQLVDRFVVNGDVFVQRVQVGRDIANRVVDLMRHARCQLAQGCQFFGLVQPGRHVVQLVGNHTFTFDQREISPPQKKPQDHRA